MMKKLLFLFLLISGTVSGQEFTRVDNIVNNYPKYRSPQQLADRISKDFSSDLDKVRASFKWLTNNISYSLDYYFHNQRTISFTYSSEKERQDQLQKIRDKIVADTFISRSGVCEEYAQSLKKLCDLMNIESTLLKGYVRNNASEIAETPEGTNHVWNAVKINGKWMFIDATWAAGFVINGRWERVFGNYFFNMPKEKIGLTHYPSDKKWQLLLNYGTLKEFYSQPIYHQYLLNHNIKLVNHTKGIISPNKDNELVFKLENLPENSRITYYYKGQRYSQKAAIAPSDGVFWVTIPAPARSTELYLFIESVSILEYKVAQH
ncbi:transglutaminase domain-containing protein [Flavobacteriaceae bacterium S356]|uniref:Transglutaminase domain-containing protein n=1 Tax=Asprobacillus argus TaxID=3076534 RepID=A0ABU3LIH5_9FLAO|nr:transglutaminase domain-containing protein [Flavobacteriaceae bacterium S356]